MSAPGPAPAERRSSRYRQQGAESGRYLTPQPIYSDHKKGLR
jgi:hypothetical protein